MPRKETAHRTPHTADSPGESANPPGDAPQSENPPAEAAVARVTLRPHKDKALNRGYPWIFKNQVARVTGDPATGDVVEIAGAGGRVYGLGLYHADSLIAVRFLTSDASATIDASFFRERIRRALDLRETVFAGATHYRLIYGESDGLPGTIVDRYGDVLTWSTLSFGMEQRRDMLLDLLEELVEPSAIVERNDTALRAKDGLAESTGVLRGRYEGPVEINEAGLRFAVDVMSGPKTGFFIDQRLHREMIRRFVDGRRVLDVFSADGGFGLHAAAAGAVSVHLIDTSGPALQRASANAVRNGLRDRILHEEVDALQRMGDMVEEGRRFDVVILDPPSFAKSRRQTEAAKKAYQRINITALQMLEPGGILATSSCSQAVSEDDFLKVIAYSARKAHAPLRLLYRGSQPPDHPVLETMPETHYLKFFIYQKLADEVPGSPFS